jgi:hypothetical protein
MRVRSLLIALGINAIPAAGWFVGEWTAATTLVLYWLETLLGTVFLALRILLHRYVRPTRGHYDYRAPQRQAPEGEDHSTYLSAFLVPALGFTFAHGLFLVVLLTMMSSRHLGAEATVNRENLLTGLAGIAVFQLTDFAFDLVSLSDRSFAWLERLGQRTLGRVFVIHFTIIGGMVAVMFTGANRSFFGVFIFLKTLLNCGSLFPQWQPKTPPAWLSKVMDRIKDPKFKGTTFAEYWRQTDEQESARLAHNEEPLATGQDIRTRTPQIEP